ncbi:MAG: hypothetical protein ACI3XZ_08500 [Butyricicoccus sp.]
MPPTEGLPEGKYYVFFKIISTAADDPSKTAFIYTDFVKLTFHKADFGMEGSGTPADPFPLKTGEDFEKIQKLVKEQGQTLSGITLRPSAQLRDAQPAAVCVHQQRRLYSVEKKIAFPFGL